MGRIIRRTVTITITETWTITWTTDEPPPATTIVQQQRKTAEEADETILPAVTTGAGTDRQPTDSSPKSGTGNQRKRRRNTG